MADSQSNVNKINLIAPINVDPIGENVWSFDEEAQHVQNTGFVFDNGIANLNEKESSSPSGVSSSTTGYMYTTSDGDIITLSNISATADTGSTNQWMRKVYINDKFVDNVNAYGVEESYSLSGVDAVIGDSGEVLVLKTQINAGFINLILENYVSGTLTASKTIITAASSISSVLYSCGIIRATYGRSLMSYTTVRFWIHAYVSSASDTFFVINNDGTTDFSNTTATQFTIDAQSQGATVLGSGFPKFNASMRKTVCRFYNTDDYSVAYNGLNLMYDGSVVPNSFWVIRKSSSTSYTTQCSSGSHQFSFMQSKNGYNTISITGTKPYGVGGVSCDMIGYTSYGAAPYTIPVSPANMAISGNILNEACFYNTAAVATDYNTIGGFCYYETATISKGQTSLLSTILTANSRNVFIRRAVLNTVNNSINELPFYFCASFLKDEGVGSPLSPSFMSVAAASGQANGLAEMQNLVYMGVPLSDFGSYDVSFMPLIGPNSDTLLWAELDGTFKVVKIGYNTFTDSSLRPPLIQKISNDVYKINTIDPICIIDKTTNQLELGSNDYSGQFRTSFSTALPIASEYTTNGSLYIQGKFSNSTDYGDKPIKTDISLNSTQTSFKIYRNGTAATTTQGQLNGYEIFPFIHKNKNYFSVIQYDNFRLIGTPVGVPFCDCYGSPYGLYTTRGTPYYNSYQYEPWLDSVNFYPTHTVNVTLPIPITSVYAKNSLPTNSSAKNPLYKKTYITSGFRGTAVTSDYDGYLTGNSYPFNADAFFLFSQGYLFDGKAIYAISFNGNYINLPPVKVIDATGLTFIGQAPNAAFFYSNMDRSLWAFDGGRTLQKVKKLDGFPQVTKAMYNTRDDALLLETGSTGFLWYREGRTTWNAKKSNQSGTLRFYDTEGGLVIGNNTTNWHYSYTTESGSTVVPLTLQTGYIGPSSNQRMILSAVTFGIYNEDRTALSFQVQMIGYDQDKLYTMSSQTFNVQPADYINGGIYRARIQDMNPQRVLAASFKLSTTSKIRIFELQYHWKEDVQAIYSGARSK